MIKRYEEFTTSISTIYKIIQKIKRDGMQRFGLKGPHTQCIVAMHHNPQGVTVSQLCELCGLDKAAISRAVSELEKKGIIEPRSNGDKLYRAPLKLTPNGSEIAAEISDIVEEVVVTAGCGLSDSDRETFYHSLNLITENLQRLTREGVASIAGKGGESHEQ